MYDVICIGGGLNYSAAVVLAKAGKKVLLIEKNLSHIGGTCLHNGCIPSKNFLHRAKVVLESKEDVFKQNAKIDFKKLSDLIKNRLDKNTQAITTQCKISGIELIEGEGYVVDDGVEVNGKVLQAKFIIIGIGSKAMIPNGIEYDKKHIITSKEALELPHIPKEISIYGTGAIGLEMASIFSAFGSKVNLIYRHNNISKKYPQEITKRIEQQLQSIGINLMPNSSIESAKTKNNKVIMNINNKEIETEYLLVATGRKPNLDVLKTDKIKTSKGIDVDNYFETSMKNVFAIGDSNGKQLLAHSARAQALNVAHYILTGEKKELNLDNIPKFIYTIPLGYANVGVKSDKEAIFKLSSLGISGSSLNDENGIIIVYSDKDNFITGADIFAPNAEELIGIFTTLLAGELDKNIMLNSVFPHPTYSEAIGRVISKL